MSFSKNTLIITYKEAILLKAFRYFLLAYTEHDQAHCQTAMGVLAANFGGKEKGRQIGFSMLRVLQEARYARTNHFVFVTPCCEKCSYQLMDCERYLIESLKHVFGHDISKAHVPAMLLCEGADTDKFIDSVVKLKAELGIPEPEKTKSKPWHIFRKNKNIP